MAEEQQNTSVAEDAPEQMEQIRALQAMFEQLKSVVDAMQDPKDKTPLDSPPPPDNTLPPSNTATPPLAAQNSRRATFSSSAAHSSTQGSPGRSQGSRKTRTRYELDINDKGEKSVRRYRKRPPPYDPKKDPQMVCHTAAHGVCSAIMRLLGSSGDW